VAKAAPNYVNCEFSLVHPYLDSVDDHLVGTYAGGSQRVKAPSGRTTKGRQTIAEFKLHNPNYLAAINKQALLKSLNEWRAMVPSTYRPLWRNALAELSGRRRY
jgi:hypothetical protein